MTNYCELEHSAISILTHEKEECQGGHCAFHNRSDHHMRNFRQFYRLDRGIMERICSHDIGHPDPDEISILNGEYDGVHGCDGCCIRFATEEEVAQYGLR